MVSLAHLPPPPFPRPPSSTPTRFVCVCLQFYEPVTGESCISSPLSPPLPLLLPTPSLPVGSPPPPACFFLVGVHVQGGSSVWSPLGSPHRAKGLAGEGKKGVSYRVIDDDDD